MPTAGAAMLAGPEPEQSSIPMEPPETMIM